MVYVKSSSRLGEVSSSLASERKFLPYKLQWDTYVRTPGMFLSEGTFKSPELNAFLKLELLKTLLSFSRPLAHTSVNVKQFVSATPNKIIA
jgi:hypothetical protein